MSLPIYIYFERMRAYTLYTVRSYDVNLGNCRHMIVRLDIQDGNWLFSGVFMGYVSGGNLNSSGLVESPTSIVHSPINGVYREENNGELILVGYITCENYLLLYRFSCLECDLLFRYPSFLNNHLRRMAVHFQSVIDISRRLVIEIVTREIVTAKYSKLLGNVPTKS
ncbi:15774_t:CDS:2 [Acaulospora morrowiae]|uniref:15774_t:CDS:1 n=1 Tax=Acaulospora morrowiae TaxID=94023 RepID=A0A9N8ZRY9_9GLOM|nr:15774_t:CDS:2 [Acaulospora morrowiae]